MQLTPRYDGPPLLRFDVPVGPLAATVRQQRRRLLATLGTLDDEQWAHPSRCEGWTVRDVAAHLVTTDGFWTASVRAALTGEPTQLLHGFDPVATPAALVASTSDGPAEVLANLTAAADAFLDALEDVEDWTLLGEAPPGHVPLDGVARHALWDAWVHERDIVLPLGLTPVEEPDEVMPCLQYAAALGPLFLAIGGSDRTGTLRVSASRPDTTVVVTAGETVVVGADTPDGSAVDLALDGDAVALVEALSFRGPLPGDVPARHRWLIDGLARAFDREDPA